jgi:hypothetical protein
MATSKRTAIINGTPFIGGIDIGNTSQLQVAHTYEEKTLANYQGGGGNDDSFKRLTGVKITLAARNVSVATLEAALGGTATAETAGSVASETHVAGAPGTFISLDHLQDLTATLTVKVGSTTLVEGTDYIRRRGGIVTVVGGDIDEDDEVDIAYTKLSGQRIQALLYTALDNGLVFDGINERTGKPWKANFYRVSWAPADNFDFIGDDFATFTITGEVLRDEARVGAGMSQFYDLLVGDL